MEKTISQIEVDKMVMVLMAEARSSRKGYYVCVDGNIITDLDLDNFIAKVKAYAERAYK